MKLENIKGSFRVRIVLFALEPYIAYTFYLHYTNDIIISINLLDKTKYFFETTPN